MAPWLGSEHALRQRENTLIALAVLVVVVGALVFGTLLWNGVQSRESRKATLGNRAVALASLWLNCRNYQALHPRAPIEESCKNMPAHPPDLPEATGG
jgi:heme/copper-type cytochrome/quinol oxidase subunit 2